MNDWQESLPVAICYPCIPSSLIDGRARDTVVTAVTSYIIPLVHLGKTTVVSKKLMQASPALNSLSCHIEIQRYSQVLL